jgi:hypothetical protein
MASPPPAAARAAQSLEVLPASALYREPRGSVTARQPLASERTQRAIAALGASVERDEELPADIRAAARAAVLEQWRVAPREARPQPARAAAAQRFASELLETRFVADATFAAALEALGERGLVNLVVVMGHSNMRCAQQALAGSACIL